uniref:WD repeat, SAM and U-box domain-containing protein 1 n=1 Tax=Leptobrachium leishanense TaxID=445787 RepID=A0A8C5PR84_9ANUR
MAELIHTFADHGDDVNSCAFSDTFLATCSLDKAIRVYTLNDFKEVPFSPLRGHTYGVHCCCFSSKSPILASCSTDGKTILWSMDNGQILATFRQPTDSPVRVCRFSPSSLYLASGAADGTVVLWNVPLLKMHRSSSVKDGSLVACTFCPRGNIVVTGSSCGDLTAWDENMRCLQEKKAHDLGVACCDFSSQTVTTSFSQVLSWFSLGFEMICKGTLSGHSAPVLALHSILCPSFLFYGNKPRCVLHILNHHNRYVTACAFASAHPLLATGSMDKTVCVWKLGNNKNDLTGKSETFIPPFNDTVEHWSEDDVRTWLSEEGLSEVEHLFKVNNIDGKELLNLTKDVLLQDLKIESLGIRNKILRKIEELKNTLNSAVSDAPGEFLCPITCEVMKDPVIASDGYSYERTAIESWISAKRTSPMTNLPLENLLLTPNRTLKMALMRWLETPSQPTPGM